MWTYKFVKFVKYKIAQVCFFVSESRDVKETGDKISPSYSYIPLLLLPGKITKVTGYKGTHLSLMV